MRLSHHRRGSGETLLLIPGTGASWQTWEPVIGLLSSRCEVVAIDLPGFGDSLTLRDEPPTVAALARAVREFAGEDAFHAAGYSLGGAIALELGRLGAVASVCAISPTGFWTARERVFCRTSLQASRSLAQRLEPHAEKLLSSPVGRALLAQLVAKPSRMPREQAAHAIRVLANSPGFDATLEHALVDQDSGVALRCPTTVAWGTQDRLLLPRQADRARRMLPTAKHVWLKGCGHVPTWDDPEAVTGVLLDAMQRSRQPREPAAA
jgi:pimeloyl-ACP methyl ester carboxylesterase